VSGQEHVEVLAGVSASREDIALPQGDARAIARRRGTRLASLAGVLAGIVSCAVIFASMKAHLANDFPAHIGLTIDMIRGGPPRGEFLFFMLNALFAGFSTDRGVLEISLAFVLGAAIGTKVWLSVRFIAAERRAAIPTRLSGLPGWAVAAGALCAFAAALPVAGRHYLGEIPPSIWHNSTTILLMPFALGLFWTTLRFLETGATTWLWRSAPLVVLSLAAKPSFMLSLLPAFALLTLLRFRTSPPARRAILLVAGMATLLVLQTVYLYNVDSTIATNAGVAVEPLAVWHYFSRDIPLSILASLVFPMTALTLGGTDVRANLAVRYATVLLAAALVQYALFAEKGPYRLSGNFTWQAIVVMWVLFVALVSALVPWYERRPVGARQLMIAVAFLAQVVAGVLFFQHWFATGSYN
jgi:hypothetical protein